MIRRIVKNIFPLLLLLVLYHCATRSAPTGGPVDRIPPFILSTEPSSDTTGIRALNEIRIQFSERMNEGSLGKALFISPPLEYEMLWKRGRTLIVQIQDTLKADQTYVVSIGSEASDSRNNKMEKSIQFAFSSGNVLDQGAIGGTVHGRKPNETATLFAYTISGDSLDLEQKPDYISQSGADGDFEFNYMKTGHYRIFAVIDQNNNLQIDADYEQTGIPSTDVTLDSSGLRYIGLNFRLSRSDTLPPQVLAARAIHDRYLQLRLSEPVIIPEINRFQLRDSLNTKSIDILTIAKNIENSNTLDIFTSPIDTSVYELIVPVVRDSSNNTSGEKKSVFFRGKSDKDTTDFILRRAEPADSVHNHHPEDQLYLEFSNPVIWDSIDHGFQLADYHRHPVDGEWLPLSAFDAYFKPDAPLIPDSSYTYTLDIDRVRDVWQNQLEDSTFSRYFKVLSEREMGEISGHVSAPSDSGSAVSLRIHHLQRRGFVRKFDIEKPGPFLKNYLPEGQYRIDAFLDLDGDGQYFTGRLLPFRFSEPFVVHPDTIKVRKRWETGQVHIRFPSTKD